MASASTPDAPPASGPDWPTSIAAGAIAAVVIGIVIWAGFDSSIIAESIPDPFGLSGAVAGWAILLVIGVLAGLGYGLLNAVEPLDTMASTARTGAVLGLGYGLALWVVAMVVVPLIVGDGTEGIGDYAVTSEGILAFALFGVLIGFLYLLVPVLTSR